MWYHIGHVISCWLNYGYSSQLVIGLTLFVKFLYCTVYIHILWLFQKISLWKELTPFQEGEGNLIYFRCPKGTKFISVEFVFKSTASVNPLLLHHINQDDQSTLMATTYISSLFMFCGLAFSKTPKGVLKIALMSRQHQLVKFYVPMSEKGGCNFGLSFQLSEGEGGGGGGGGGG